ncbi:MAG: LamG-like jellyroll fold domain-containing protein [Candidatus Thorarchaeota archaeon]
MKLKVSKAGFILFLLSIQIISATVFLGNNTNLNEVEKINKDFKKKSIRASSTYPNDALHFKYYKNISINHDKVMGIGNHSNFPVLISILDNDLHSYTQPDGDDIAFSMGSIWLDHEIEMYNRDYSATQAKLIAWVRVPGLSTSNDTIIRMYFCNLTMTSRENPAGVWNNNYLGVWHLSESNGNAKDSTSYMEDGTVSGGVTQGTSGQIANSYYFDRDSMGTVNMGDPSDGHLDFRDGDDFSISFWINLDYFYYYNPFIVSKRAGIGSSSQGYSVQMYDDSHGIPFYGISSNGPEYEVDGTNDCLYQGWKYITATWDEDNSSGCKIYLDGLEETSNRIGTIGNIDDISNAENFKLNGPSSPNTEYMFDGKLDEVRVSDIVRSSDWIATEYNNQYDPASFYSIGLVKEVIPLKSEYFNFYKVMTIDHTKVAGTNDLVDYPLFLSLIDPDLKDQVQSDGDDIVFAMDGSWLDHEIELFDQNYDPNYGKLIAWIRIPILYHSIDTEIYMYYGNSTMRSHQNPLGVWNNNYKGVWHLSELSGNSMDSTGYGTEGVPTVGVTQGESSLSGYGYDFDGIDSNVDFGDPIDDHLDFGINSFTISMWLRIDSSTATWQVPLTKGHPSGASNDGYRFETSSDGQRIYFQIGDGNIFESSYSQNIIFGAWMHIVGRVDRASNRIYLFKDGGHSGYKDISSIGNIITSSPLTFSRMNNALDGVLDEVRISDTSRSDGWIATEYNNQYNPDTFYSISDRNHVRRPKPEYFNFYKALTIDHNKVSGITNLIDFPLLISLEDPDLKDQVQSDGDDIAFWNGSAWLDHEIEFFDQNYNPSFGKLVVWVRIPILYYYKDTTIYMCYGNLTLCSQESSKGVWDRDYDFVLHMNQDPSSSDILDSTLNGFDFNVETGGVMTSGDLVDGKAGKAIAFDGNDDYIYLPESEGFSGSIDKMTFEFWLMLPNGVPSVRDTLARPATTDRSPNLYFLQEFSFQLDTITSSTVIKTTESFQTAIGRWIHFACVWDGTGGGLHQIYVNGSLNSEDSTPLTGTHVNWNTISVGTDDDPSDGPGGIADGARFLEVTLSEFRVSKVVRSADWIATEYNNQYDPDNFYSISTRIHVKRPKPEDFQSLKMIFIDHNKVSGSSDLINFPFLISIYDEDLHDDVQPDGDDIAFWNGTEWLDHEIELFDQTFNNTHAQLVTWIRIPKLYHDVDTIIYMYYGNSTLCSQENSGGVWNSNYAGVWHLLESNGYAVDSTIYGEHGFISGAVEQGSIGKINSAYNFDVNGSVNVGDPSDGHLDFNEVTDFTVSFWLNIDATTTVKQRPLYKGGSSLSDGGYSFETSTSGDLIKFYICDETNRVGSYSAPITYDQWTYITGVVDRTNGYIYIYKDHSVITGAVSISSIGGSLSNDVELQFPLAASDLDGLIDEIRISNVKRSADWIATEYYSQHDPNSFFSVGPEIEVGEVSVEVHVIDLYGNFIPNLNVTMGYNSIIYETIANNAGIATFENVSKLAYNFTVEMTSDIGAHTVIVNKTTDPILVDDPIEVVYLICNVSTNFIEVRDIDGISLNSGWVIVGNSSHNLQNCTIEETGYSRFWWLNSTPYNYNFTVYYRDANYNPSTVNVGSGYITTVNSTIFAATRLTTVNFSVNTEEFEPIGGAKLILNYTHTLENVINLTTDVDGKTTFRWLNTTSFYDYSLKIIFLGKRWNFDISSVTPGYVSEFDLSISSRITYNIVIKITQTEIEEYETAIVSLNPVTTISIEWGSILALRALFNVTKVPGSSSIPLGPTSADSIFYKIYLFGDTNPLKTGLMAIDTEYKGSYRCDIDIKGLECELYSIKISAYKSGYVIPQDLLITLNVLKNELFLNQSENNDSPQNIYWLDHVNMTVAPYGENSESFTLEDSLLQSNNQAFDVIIYDITNYWNLSSLTLNIQEISWTTSEPNIYIEIVDPYFNTWKYDPSNFSYYDYDKGVCYITLNLNKGSPTFDNIFRFNVTGSFNGSIDIAAESCFIRDNLEVQYSQFNIKDEIIIINEAEGWAIKNITFNISNFYNVSSGQLIDPATAIDCITTREGFKYALESSELGKGTLSINNITIYPLDNQFSFGVQSNIDIIFDVVINVKYIQYFYQNEYLESFNSSIFVQNFDNSLEYLQVSAIESDWTENLAEFIITDIYDGIKYVTPSEVAMNITIGGQPYSIMQNVEGEGIISIGSLEKGIIHSIIIQANKQVNFSFIYKIIYTRTNIYEIGCTVNFIIREAPDIFGPVEYYDDLNCYIKEIDTSLIDADNYTVRFTATKDYFFECLKDLKLNVISRRTLINGTLDYFREIESIYVGDVVNLEFEFTDAITGEKIINLTTHYFVWEQYSADGSVISSGNGILNTTIDNFYALDFDSETRPIGNYMLIATLDKENYDYKNVMIFLTIETRFLQYSLSSNIKNYKISIVQGNTVQISLNLTDPTRGGIPLLNATINLSINDIDYNFEEVSNGTYILNFRTDNVDSFFSPQIFTGIINITKKDYFSETFSVTIVVEMIEIFPGMPMFYFLLIIFSILAVVGSLVGYRVYKHAKIPTFVKKVREMQKEIKREKSISEALLYQPKEEFIGELVRDKWSAIGLSLGDILGIEITKSKKLPRKLSSRAGEVHDLKPLGLILTKWDERVGMELLAKYPQDIHVSDKTFMQIYGTHEYSGEKGIITLISGGQNVLSYYTGPETAYYITLILDTNDDSDIYEAAMPNIARIILENLEDQIYLQMIPSFFQRLSVYPSLTDEQNLIFHYQDDIKRMIINFLRDYGVISKSELMIWMKDRKLEGITDLEAILAELIKSELIKVASVKGIPSELIFFTKDIFMLRVPPDKLFENPVNYGLPKQFAKSYQTEVNKFFNEYHPTEEDELKLLDNLIDPEVYEAIRLLRTAIITMKDFEKLKKKGINDIYAVLKKLWDTNMIKVFNDKDGTEYYALLTDFYIGQIFPKYILNIIKLSYEQKSKTNKVLQEYLSLLENTYTDIKSKK